VLFGWDSDLTPDIYLHRRTQDREQRHKIPYPEGELTKGSQKQKTAHTVDYMAIDLYTAAATEQKFDPRIKQVW
jgi:hypothetical protein